MHEAALQPRRARVERLGDQALGVLDPAQSPGAVGRLRQQECRPAARHPLLAGEPYALQREVEALLAPSRPGRGGRTGWCTCAAGCRWSRDPPRSRAPRAAWAMPVARSPSDAMSTPFVLSACASVIRSPAARAISMACSASSRDSARSPLSISTCASEASTFARSGLGGSAGISSTARAYSSAASHVAPGRPQIAALARAGHPGRDGIGVADQLHHALAQRRGAVHVAGQVGEPGRPAQQLDQRRAARLLGDIHLTPEVDGVLEMARRVGRRAHALGLAGRLDRRGQGAGQVVGLEPVPGQLRGGTGAVGGQRGVGRQRLGQAHVQIAALARQQVLVDGFAHQRVPERVALGPVPLHEHVVRDRLAQRLDQRGPVAGGDAREQPVRDAAPRGGDHAQQLLGAAGQRLDAHHQGVAQRLRQRRSRCRRRWRPAAPPRRTGCLRSARTGRRPRAASGCDPRMPVS